MIDPLWSAGRVAEFEEGNSVRFRTRGAGSRAGDGGYSGHAGREIVHHNDGEKDRWVNVARLSLFAWTPDMDIEDLWALPADQRTPDPRTDKMEAHHIIPVPWLNTEWNLEWRDPYEHGEIESERRERGDDGAFTGPRVPEEAGWAAPNHGRGVEADGGQETDGEKASSEDGTGP